MSSILVATVFVLAAVVAIALVRRRRKSGKGGTISPSPHSNPRPGDTHEQ